MISIRDEYAPTFGRQRLTAWRGAFASDYIGEALELPNHDGYIVALEYGQQRVRVSCEAPRTESNFQRVDAAIVAALTEAGVAA